MVARASSCVGESWCHAMFKVKYCHEVFDMEEVRMYVFDLLIQISINYDMPVEKIGFDPDHVHFDVNIKLRSKPEAAKILKGVTGKMVLKKFPKIKKKFFWGSGFWNPAYLLDNIGRNKENVENYIKRHKYSY
jgi:putative transposase